MSEGAGENGVEERERERERERESEDTYKIIKGLKGHIGFGVSESRVASGFYLREYDGHRSRMTTGEHQCFLDGLFLSLVEAVQEFGRQGGQDSPGIDRWQRNDCEGASRRYCVFGSGPGVVVPMLADSVDGEARNDWNHSSGGGHIRNE